MRSVESGTVYVRFANSQSCTLPDLRRMNDLGLPDEIGDERDDEKDDRHPEQNARTFHCRAGDTAKAQESRDKCDDQENDCVMQKIAHGTLLFVGLRHHICDLAKTLKEPECSSATPTFRAHSEGATDGAAQTCDGLKDT